MGCNCKNKISFQAQVQKLEELTKIKEEKIKQAKLLKLRIFI